MMTKTQRDEEITRLQQENAALRLEIASLRAWGGPPHLPTQTVKQLSIEVMNQTQMTDAFRTLHTQLLESRHAHR